MWGTAVCHCYKSWAQKFEKEVATTRFIAVDPSLFKHKVWDVADLPSAVD